MFRSVGCGILVLALAGVAGGAICVRTPVGDGHVAVVRPDRYANDPGAGFPVVLLTDVTEPSPDVKAFADAYREAVFVCAGTAERPSLLTELAKDPRLFAFPRGRLELTSGELKAADAADRLRTYFKWGVFQAEAPRRTRYGARIYRRVRASSAAPTLTVPEPWRIVEGDDGETGCDSRLCYFTVEADGENVPAPTVTVSWPGVPISSVDGAKDVSFAADGVVLTPTARSGGANYLTMVRDGAIELALHHHVDGAQHGPYGGRPLPWARIRASDNWRAACWAMFKSAGLDSTNATDGADIKLYGFDSNFPRRHVDFPAHFHVMLEWDGWKKNNVGHYTLDGQGLILENNFLVCGDISGGLPNGYHPQKPGATTEYVGPKGRTCFSLEMLADGKGLVLRKPGTGAAWRLRSECPDREVVLERCECRGAAWRLMGRYSVRDDTEKGEYVVSCSGTDDVKRTVIRYARDTGALRE